MWPRHWRDDLAVALSLYLTLYLQQFLGEGPLVAGEHLIALTGVLFVFGAMSGSWVSRIPARIQIGVGLGLLGIGLILMSGLSLTDKWTALLPGLIVAGAGAGIVNTVIADVAVSVVPKEQSGLASGANDAFRNLGIAVGIAGWGALLTARGASRITTLLPAAHASARQLINAVSAGQLPVAVSALPPGARVAATNAARQGFLSGLNEVLLLGGALALIGAVAGTVLVREREIIRETIEDQPPIPEPMSPESVAA